MMCVLTLIWVRGSFTPCWFSLSNSETVKAVIQAICRIQQLFIRNIHAKFGIPNSPQPLDVGQNSDKLFSISEFLVNPL